MHESGCQTNKTHNPCDESHWVSHLRENLTSGFYGGLETDQKYLTPRQSFTRQLFFEWIKQNLRIKAFYGTSENAVKTQIWIAVTTYLLVAIMKKQHQIEASLYTILQVLSVTSFERIPFNQLLAKSNYKLEADDADNQLFIFT